MQDYIDYLRKGEPRVAKYEALVSSCLKCCAQDSVVQDVLFIANDWQTGLLPVYHLYKYRRNNTYRNSRCVFVIHNIGYQAGMSAQASNVPRFLPKKCESDGTFSHAKLCQGKYRTSKFAVDGYLGLPPEVGLEFFNR